MCFYSKQIFAQNFDMATYVNNFNLNLAYTHFILSI